MILKTEATTYKLIKKLFPEIELDCKCGDSCQAKYLKIQYESKDAALVHEHIKNSLYNILEHFDYDENQKTNIWICSSELIANALMHGNKYFNKELLIDRGLEVPKNMEDNKHKIITIDAIICNNHCLGKFYDQGKGFKKEDLPKKINHESVSGRGFLGIIQNLAKEYHIIKEQSAVSLLFSYSK